MTEPVKWLDRLVAPMGPHLCLCLSQAEFEAALDHLKAQGNPPFVNPGAGATTHTYVNDERRPTCIVCLSEEARSREPVEVAAMLVHEAVHVWQQYCDYLNDRDPGREQEAYAIQFISEHLMGEYARRLQQ